MLLYLIICPEYPHLCKISTTRIAGGLLLGCNPKNIGQRLKALAFHFVQALSLQFDPYMPVKLAGGLLVTYPQKDPRIL